MTVDERTTNAVTAADPAATARTIPAGLPPHLLLPVMLVQSDLMSRYSALLGFDRAITATSAGVVSVSDQSAQEALACLSNGTQAAASFGTDLVAARATAANTPPISVAAPDSRAAADLAVLIQNLNGRSSACMSCGRSRETTLATIT
ncbi:MAG TPA: hypothetical protein VNC61_02730 [Acidimicrobiales bacterium]|nr:hypothetical protein [Acidimicrobiales bacterium]